MSSNTWQDRRFMGMSGREVHQPSRRMSGSSATSDTSPILADTTPVVTQALPEYPVVEKKVLSNPDAWGGNRLFMSMSGREVHEPGRRPSGSSSTKPVVELPKAASPPAPASTGGGVAAALAGRRRSSASTGGAFSGLMANRSSHNERHQAWEDMKNPGGIGGFLSNLVNTKPAEKK